MDLKRWLLLMGYAAVLAATPLYAAPQLQLSNTAFGPINIGAGTNGPSVSVQITNIGDGTLNLSASASASWLVPTIGNGTLQIALSTASLTSGTYTEFVTVNAPGAIDAPQTISVTVTIGGVPNTLDFYVVPNGGTSTQSLPAQSQVGSVTTNDGAPWLAVSLNGSFSFFYPYLVTVTSQPGQGVGDYTGTIALVGGANPADAKNVSVRMHITTQPILSFGSALPVKITGVVGGSKVSQTYIASNIGVAGTSLNLTSAAATTSSGGNFLNATTGANGQVTITADPGSLQPGTYSGTVTLSSNAANTSAGTIPVQFTVTTPTAPNISFGGVVDNTTFKPILSPGGIASLFGSQLAGATASSASSLPLQTTLSGVRVLVNNIPAPVYYTSSGQINFQVPFAVQPGTAQVSVQYNGQTGNTVTTTIQARAPRILRLGIANYAIIVNQDGSFPIPTTAGLNSHPAKIGDVLTMYCIGLGATSPAVADGAGAPAAEPLARTPTPVVTFGGGFAGTPVSGPVYYSGLTPGFVGLYQINVGVPEGTPFGSEIGLQFSLDGATSNNVFLAVGR